MRETIKKILKEEPFDWAESIVNPPAQILDNLELDIEWHAYIPEISRQISFSVNPESHQPMASVRVTNVESRGHGSFGDDPHRNYTPSTLDNLGFGRSNWMPEGHEPVGEDERRGKLYNVMDVAKDMKGYSEEAKQLTLEYRQKIQSLTSELVENFKAIHSKHHFDNEEYGTSVTVATVDNEGKAWTDNEWDDVHGGGEFRKYPGHREVWEKSHEIGHEGKKI